MKASIYVDTDEPPPVMTVEEVAVLLRIGRTKAYELARLYLSSGGRSGIPTIELVIRR